jgi:uncharacterized oxidoreductase
MKISGNKVLITGGATGIGLGLTERFLQEGNTVIICGRRQDVLKEVSDKHPAVITKACDLANEADRIELYNWVATNHSDLNILVNNAGIQNWMHPSDKDFYEKAQDEITINVLAPLHLVTLFAQLKNLDTVINVTSALAFSPLTKVPVYCGTKAFFHSLTLSLRYLLHPQNIEVLEIIPPALNTDLGGAGLHNEHPPVNAFIDAIFQQMKEGKNELTFGLSDMLSKASPEQLQGIFKRMNP